MIYLIHDSSDRDNERLGEAGDGCVVRVLNLEAVTSDDLIGLEAEFLLGLGLPSFSSEITPEARADYRTQAQCFWDKWKIDGRASLAIEFADWLVKEYNATVLEFENWHM